MRRNLITAYREIGQDTAAIMLFMRFDGWFLGFGILGDSSIPQDAPVAGTAVSCRSMGMFAVFNSFNIDLVGRDHNWQSAQELPFRVASELPAKQIPELFHVRAISVAGL